jgi:3-oxoacyl-[acyl-carrier-protein] synthase II
MAQCMEGKPDLINAHATSTPMGDIVELDAINRLGMKDVYITANKSQLGHMMGAAGAVETALSVMSLMHNIVTPSLNINKLEEGYEPKYVSRAIGHNINSVLCNSFGFGGTNASILLTK